MILENLSLNFLPYKFYLKCAPNLKVTNFSDFIDMHIIL